jgi:hypothetical protein
MRRSSMVRLLLVSLLFAALAAGTARRMSNAKVVSDPRSGSDVCVSESGSKCRADGCQAVCRHPTKWIAVDVPYGAAMGLDAGGPVWPVAACCLAQGAPV